MSHVWRFTREEFLSDHPDGLFYPSSMGLGVDYAYQAFFLTAGTGVFPKVVEVHGADPAPRHVTVRVQTGNLVRDVACCRVLRSVWNADLFPILSITHFQPLPPFSAALDQVLSDEPSAFGRALGLDPPEQNKCSPGQ